MSDADRSETDAAEAQHPALSIDVKRGNPTAAELAALIAVVSESYAGEADSAIAAEPSTPSAWARTARGLRTAALPGAVWGRFEG